MKTIILAAIFSILPINAIAATISDENLKIGKSASTDQTIVFKSGPALKANQSTGKIQGSNDGTTFYNIGDMFGPASSTDEAVCRFDSTTGKLTQSSVVTITDAGIISGATQFNVDNLRLDGNTMTSQDTNGNINITPNGTGDLVLDGLKWPQADGTTNQVLTTNASGQLSWTTTGSSNAGFYGAIIYPKTANCMWETSSGSYADFTADTDCGTVTTRGGSTSAPATKIPAIKFSTMPAGDYLISITGAFFNQSDDLTCAWRLYDGTNSSDQEQITSQSSGTTSESFIWPTLTFRMSYGSTQTNITLSLQAKDLSGVADNCAIDNRSTSVPFVIDVYRF